MPNTSPVIDTPDLVKFLTRDMPLELRVLPAVTKGLKSKELTDLQALLKAGAVGFTDDGMPVSDENLMRSALQFSKESNIPITQHAEDLTIGARGAVRSGPVAEKLGVPGWDPAREYSMVERDICLARETGGHLHVCHLSTRRSVELIRDAKARGIHVTCEVTPHHLTLTVDDVPHMGCNAKMNPPLGDFEDREALIEGLRDGTIDCIATDHAPHTRADKNKGLNEAAYGVIGLETAFPVCYTRLATEKRIGLGRLIDALSHRAREIYHLEKIGLFEGSRADLALIDLDSQWTIDSGAFMSKARNCPFDTWNVNGRVIWTMYRGIISTHPY
jgi:dihydroorotase